MLRKNELDAYSDIVSEYSIREGSHGTGETQETLLRVLVGGGLISLQESEMIQDYHSSLAEVKELDFDAIPYCPWRTDRGISN